MEKDLPQHKMLIYYSLGNLISAQTKEECQTGGLAEFTSGEAGGWRNMSGKMLSGNYIINPELFKKRLCSKIS